VEEAVVVVGKIQTLNYQNTFAGNWSKELGI